MNPVYYQGDLVFVIKTDSYEVGQIAAYHGSSPGLEVLHRIIGGNAKTGYVFKGDNNPSIDSIEPTAKKVIGRAVLHVPKGGIWLSPLLSPTGLGMLGFLIVGGGVTATRTRREIPRGRRKKKVKAMARKGSPWATAAAVIKIVGLLPPLLRAAALLAAVATVLAVVLGFLGWMKPAFMRNAGSTSSQSMTFSYSASVPKSPAYDSTEVTSPDPIFRRLTHRVDVHMRYQGQPGVFDVAAKLTTGTGWYTTIQIAPAKSFSGTGHDATVTLDLDTLDQRAKAAAKVIGMDATPVSVTLTARITARGLPVFTAPLQLTLGALQLVLAGGASSLVVKSSVDTGERPLVTREITAFGHSLMTASSSRGLAILLLLGAMTVAGILTLIARREMPLRTRPEIERRYPQLLVPVEPMPSPPGKPVVTVDNFPALVKLAERYGQMILTWRRPDADDFVVRDEGITYRYRIPLDEPTLQNLDQISRPPTAGTHRRTASSPLP
jgi:hypothetical protein